MQVTADGLEVARHACLEILRGVSPSFVLLVGSLARGYSNAGSDIDIVVIGGKSGCVDGEVSQIKIEGHPVKVEYYSDEYIDLIKNLQGPDIVRQLNRFRDAKSMYNGSKPWADVVPKRIDVVRAFGDPCLVMQRIESQMEVSLNYFASEQFDNVCLSAYCAAESLALVLLSIGNVPLAYTKPKWSLFGIEALGHKEISASYSAALRLEDFPQEADSVVLAVKQLEEIVYGAIPTTLLESRRDLRRSIWLAKKNFNDANSLLREGRIRDARSPLTFSYSLLLETHARAFGLDYADLFSAWVSRSYMSAPMQVLFAKCMFPSGTSTKENAKQAHNGAVVLYDLVLKNVTG